MTNIEIINSVLSGGLLGTLGQGIRVAVGMKKMNDATVVQTEPFSASRLVISIFIGFIAGAIAMLIKGPSLVGKDQQFSTEAIVTIMAIGYSGADFIEGVFNTYIKNFSTSTSGVQNTSSQANQPTDTNANSQQLDNLIAG